MGRNAIPKLEHHYLFLSVLRRIHFQRILKFYDVDVEVDYTDSEFVFPMLTLLDTQSTIYPTDHPIFPVVTTLQRSYPQIILQFLGFGLQFPVQIQRRLLSILAVLLCRKFGRELFSDRNAITWFSLTSVDLTQNVGPNRFFYLFFLLY